MNKLSKHAQKGNDQAQELLANYISDGPINHMRVYACACLAKSVKVPHVEFASFFAKGLSDPELRYWSILGYVNSAGKSAYKELTRMAEDTSIPIGARAHAVKCL